MSDFQFASDVGRDTFSLVNVRAPSLEQRLWTATRTRYRKKG